MTEYRVRFEIDVEADSPREAAKDVWRNTMGRFWPPDPDDACVFDVCETAVACNTALPPMDTIDLADDLESDPDRETPVGKAESNPDLHLFTDDEVETMIRQGLIQRETPVGEQPPAPDPLAYLRTIAGMQTTEEVGEPEGSEIGASEQLDAVIVGARQALTGQLQPPRPEPATPKLLAAAKEALGIFMEGPVATAAYRYGAAYTVKSLRDAIEEALLLMRHSEGCKGRKAPWMGVVVDRDCDCGVSRVRAAIAEAEKRPPEPVNARLLAAAREYASAIRRHWHIEGCSLGKTPDAECDCAFGRLQDAIAEAEKAGPARHGTLSSRLTAAMEALHARLVDPDNVDQHDDPETNPLLGEFIEAFEAEKAGPVPEGVEAMMGKALTHGAVVSYVPGQLEPIRLDVWGGVDFKAEGLPPGVVLEVHDYANGHDDQPRCERHPGEECCTHIFTGGK